MYNFDMKIEQNYAVFRNGKNVIIVDSFDNKMFNVRAGKNGISGETYPVGSFLAKTDEDLNQGLYTLMRIIK